jgi:hypothetical protein
MDGKRYHKIGEKYWGEGKMGPKFKPLDVKFCLRIIYIIVVKHIFLPYNPTSIAMS